MKKKLEELLDEHIRPSLAAHGGGVQIIDIKNYKIYVSLQGGCQGCSSASSTLKDGIEKLVLENFPMIKEVVDVTNHSSGNNPYM